MPTPSPPCADAESGAVPQLAREGYTSHWDEQCKELDAELQAFVEDWETWLEQQSEEEIDRISKCCGGVQVSSECTRCRSRQEIRMHYLAPF